MKLYFRHFYIAMQKPSSKRATWGFTLGCCVRDLLYEQLACTSMKQQNITRSGGPFFLVSPSCLGQDTPWESTWD